MADSIERAAAPSAGAGAPEPSAEALEAARRLEVAADAADEQLVVLTTQGVRGIARLLRAAPPERQASGERDAISILRRIVAELPYRRDWLDPDLEASARAVIVRAASPGATTPEAGENG